MRINTLKAFRKKDSNLSRIAHNNYKYVECHKNIIIQYTKNFISSSLHGLISSLIILHTCKGSNFDTNVANSLSISNIFIHGLGYSIIIFITNLTEISYIKKEYEREIWETDNYLEGELKEMRELYQKKYNINNNDANIILNTMCKYPKLFIDHMMVIELELFPPSTYNKYQNNVCFFISFTSYSFLATIPFLMYKLDISNNHKYLCLYSISSVVLVSLSYIESCLTNTSFYKSSFYFLLTGSLLSSIAYAIGTLF